MTTIKKINNHVIELSNLQKILFPKTSITKKQIIDYYQKIANTLLPHAYNHLVVMHRFPSGIDQEGFYQKQIPDYFPSWLSRKTIDLKKGEKQTLVLVEKTADLVYLANQGVITLHLWLSSIDAINKPDKLVFDLDPSHHDIQTLHEALHILRECLASYDLQSFVMTTGSRGYHVIVPLIAQHTFEKIHAFAHHIATTLTHQYPKIFTTTIAKSARKGKIFIDYLRNSYGQTSVAPYSIRAREGAPIATPLSWQELSGTTPQSYTIKNIFRRLGKKEDPWRTIGQHAQKLAIPKKL